MDCLFLFPTYICIILFPLTFYYGFPLVSLMKPLDINPNDEWTNVSNRISVIFLSMYTCCDPLNLFIQYLMNSNQDPYSSFSFFLVYQLLVANVFNIFCCRWPWLECLHRYVSFDQNFPLMRKSCLVKCY